MNDRPVGIDIEKLRPIDLKVAKHICIVQPAGIIHYFHMSDSQFQGVVSLEDALKSLLGSEKKYSIMASNI